MVKILMFSANTQEDQEVTLGEAFAHIDQVPTNEQSTEAFIGFVNENKETIQFLRHTNDEWLFDIPIQDPSTGDWNFQLLQLQSITTSLVKRIVENFFADMDLLQKIKSKYKLEESKELVEKITYFKIDPAFIEWIEHHSNAEDMYS